MRRILKTRLFHKTLCLAFVLAVPPAFGLSVKRQLLLHPSPEYPELARKMHVVGSVVIDITILPDGRVADPVVKSGHPLLRQSAQEAVAKWKYAPASETTACVVEVVFQLAP